MLYICYFTVETYTTDKITVKSLFFLKEIFFLLFFIFENKFQLSLISSKPVMHEEVL